MEYWEFVHGNADVDTSALRLAYGARKSSVCFDFEDAVTQIEARRKSRRKIPWFTGHDRFRFPSLQAAEQASNQAVALYHSVIVGKGNHIADLTAGLGIDAMTLALAGNRVDAFEMDANRAEALRQNADELKLENFSIHCADSIRYLKDNPGLRFDCLFIDPARRDSEGRRIFRLQDSLPNVIENMPLLLRHAPKILVKGSPLLDITQTIRDLGMLECGIQIETVSYRGEVKEVLVLMQDSKAEVTVSVTDIADAPDFPDGEAVVNYRYVAGVATGGPVRLACIDDVVPGRYLYEAGAGMRKLNCTPLICTSYPDIKALSLDGELFVSDTLHPDFPGRINKITHMASGKEAKRLRGERLRIVSSRYPLSADELRRKYGFREGDDVSLYATSLCGSKKLLILAEKVL